QGDHRCDGFCAQTGKSQANRRGNRAGQLSQPACDRGRTGVDWHFRGRARQREEGARPHRFRSVPVAVVRGLDHDPDETMGTDQGRRRHARIAEDVFLATDTAKLMKEVGLAPPAATSKTFVVMGKTFDPAKPEDYIKSFKIKKVV